MELKEACPVRRLGVKRGGGTDSHERSSTLARSLFRELFQLLLLRSDSENPVFLLIITSQAA